MNINEYIEREQQKGNNVNYSTIAKLIPCSPQYISMLANEKRRPGYIMARRIEQVTNGAVKRTNWYPNE